MEINTPLPDPRVIEDYDFTFASGQFMQLSIDRQAGDTVDFDTHPTAVMVHLAEKPSPADPGALLPSEDITVFLSHVISIQKRVREVIPLTFEQKVEWRKVMQEMSSKAVH